MKKIIGKIDPADRHVNIWGAGFAGLVLGYYLKEQGYRITIYEKSDRVGGKIQTKKTSSGLAETGPNALYLNQDGFELLKDLKLEPLPATKKLKRLLMISGRPKSPMQLGLLTKVALNAHRRPPLISDGLTVAEFFRPLLGQEKINKFLSPILSGLYAAPAESLHFKMVFNEVKEKSQFDSYWEFIKFYRKALQEKPKAELMGSVSFEGGMQTLINRLAEVLRHDIKLNYREKFRIKGNTVICTDAASAAELTNELRPELSAEFARIKYQTLSSVTVFMKRELQNLQKSFGVLIPLKQGFHSIGVLNNKAIFPTNNENILSYTFIAPKMLNQSEILEDLQKISKDIIEEDIEAIEFSHWDKALPVYDLQLFLGTKRLDQLTKKDANLAIFGNYVAGISLRDMISAAKEFAKNPT
jgi:protoporphyrinogen oxidase